MRYLETGIEKFIKLEKVQSRGEPGNQYGRTKIT